MWPMDSGETGKGFKIIDLQPAGNPTLKLKTKEKYWVENLNINSL